MEIGGVGIWSFELRYGDGAAIRDAAAELESLGYTALWVPGGIGGEVFEDCENILGATEHVPVATGILNLWMHSIQETCDGHARGHCCAPRPIPAGHRCQPRSTRRRPGTRPVCEATGRHTDVPRRDRRDETDRPRERARARRARPEDARAVARPLRRCSPVSRPA